MKNLLEHKNIVDLTGYNDLKSLSTYLGIAW
jgi:hypothetical protein